MWHFITQTLRTKYEQNQVYDESSFPQGLEPNPKRKTKIQGQVGRSPQKSKTKIQEQVGRSPQKHNAKKKPLGILHFLSKR